METRKKKLPDCRILTEEINESMIIISRINDKIQNFFSLFRLFEDEEEIEKIRSEIIDEYKLLRSSKNKCKDKFELISQIDSEFNDTYEIYDKEFSNLAQNYKSFIKDSFGSRTLSIVCNTADGLGLQVYDLQTGKTHALPSEFFHLGACVVSLPNSQLFIFSPEYNDYQQGMSCVLDLKLKTSTNVPIAFQDLYSGGTYYKDSVYLFGGAIKSRISDRARRFDLTKKLWFNVPPLPEPSSMCACTAFKDSVLICGVGHRQIYKYDLKTASYSEINTVAIESFTPRVLFKAGSRVYFLERLSGIFESELENEYIFNCVGHSVLEWGSVSNVKYYNGSICFITAGNRMFQVFKFDLASKTLNQLL